MTFAASDHQPENYMQDTCVYGFSPAAFAAMKREILARCKNPSLGYLVIDKHDMIHLATHRAQTRAELDVMAQNDPQFQFLEEGNFMTGVFSPTQIAHHTVEQAEKFLNRPGIKAQVRAMSEKIWKRQKP